MFRAKVVDRNETHTLCPHTFSVSSVVVEMIGYSEGNATELLYMHSFITC